MGRHTGKALFATFDRGGWTSLDEFCDFALVVGGFIFGGSDCGSRVAIDGPTRLVASTPTPSGCGTCRSSYLTFGVGCNRPILGYDFATSGGMSRSTLARSTSGTRCCPTTETTPRRLGKGRARPTTAPRPSMGTSGSCPSSHHPGWNYRPFRCCRIRGPKSIVVSRCQWWCQGRIQGEEKETDTDRCDGHCCYCHRLRSPQRRCAPRP